MCALHRSNSRCASNIFCCLHFSQVRTLCSVAFCGGASWIEIGGFGLDDCSSIGCVGGYVSAVVGDGAARPCQ